MSSDQTPASYRYQEALAPLARSIDDPKVQKKLSEVLALLDFNSTLNRSLELPEILDLVLFVAMGKRAPLGRACCFRTERKSVS